MPDLGRYQGGWLYIEVSVICLVTLVAEGARLEKREGATSPWVKIPGAANKGRKYPAEVLTADEVQELIGACY